MMLTNKNQIKKPLVDWYRLYRPNVWLLEGVERCSGKRLKVLYAGHELNRNYIAHLIVDLDRRIVCLGKRWLWSILKNDGTLLKNCDIAFVEVDKNDGSVNGTDVFIIPAWIDCELEFDHASERRAQSKSIRRELQKIERHQLTYEVTKNLQHFDHFYHHMYVPYIKRIHGDRAALMSYEAMMSKHDRSELVLIKQDDEFIAGENLIFEGGGVRAWSLGVKDGSQDYVKAGASAAIYYYELVYLKEKGYDRLHIGASRGFLNDGVLQYKKKWGAKLAGARATGFRMTVQRDTEAVRTFLENNPFVVVTQDKLTGVLVFDKNRTIPESQLNEIMKKYSFPGMEKLILYCSMKIQDVDMVERLFGDKVAMRDLSQLYWKR